MLLQLLGFSGSILKYQVLRELACGGDIKLGVCWMMTPGRPDSTAHDLVWGYNIRSKQQGDPELFDALVPILDRPLEERLAAFENSGIIPNAKFFSREVPPYWYERAAFMADCREAFADRDLVFLDPNQGLGHAGHIEGDGYCSQLSYDEVAAFYGDGKSVLIHQRRVASWSYLISAFIRPLSAFVPGTAIFTCPRDTTILVLVLHPDSPPSLRAAAAKRFGCHEPDMLPEAVG